MIVGVEEQSPDLQDKNKSSFNVITKGRVYELMAHDESTMRRLGMECMLACLVSLGLLWFHMLGVECCECHITPGKLMKVEKAVEERLHIV